MSAGLGRRRCHQQACSESALNGSNAHTSMTPCTRAGRAVPDLLSVLLETLHDRYVPQRDDAESFRSRVLDRGAEKVALLAIDEDEPVVKVPRRADLEYERMLFCKLP